MSLLVLVLVLVLVPSFSSVGSGLSEVTVDVDVDRLPKEFLRGPKWVSLNPVLGQCLHSTAVGERTFGKIPRHIGEISNVVNVLKSGGTDERWKLQGLTVTY